METVKAISLFDEYNRLKAENDRVLEKNYDLTLTFLLSKEKQDAEIEQLQGVLLTVLEACEDVNSPDRKVREKEMERANFWEAEADMWHQHYKNAADEIEQLREALRLAGDRVEPLASFQQKDIGSSTIRVGEETKLSRDARSFNGEK